MENALSSLALDLSHDGISLHRLESGTWIALDHIPLQVGTLKANMARLRDMADSTNGKVLVWMPVEQIHVRELELTGLTQAEQNQSIQAAFATTDGIGTDGVDFAIGTMNASGLSPVAVIATEVLEEAREFLKDHGFSTSAFSTRVPLVEFGAKPVFQQTKHSTLLTSSMLAAVAGVALAVGIGGVVWNSLDLFRPAQHPDFEIVAKLTAPDQEGAPRLLTETNLPPVSSEAQNPDIVVARPGIENDFAAFYAFPEDENSIQVSVSPAPLSVAPERDDTLPGPDTTIKTPPVIAALDSDQTGDTIPNIFTSLLLEDIEPLSSPNAGDSLDFSTPVNSIPATRANAPTSLFVKVPVTRSAAFTVPLQFPKVTANLEEAALSQPAEHFPVFLSVSELDDTPELYAQVGILAGLSDNHDPEPAPSNTLEPPASGDVVDLGAVENFDTSAGLSRFGGSAIPSVSQIPGFASDTLSGPGAVPNWADSLPPPVKLDDEQLSGTLVETVETATRVGQDELANLDNQDQSSSVGSNLDPEVSSAEAGPELTETANTGDTETPAPDATTEINEIVEAIEEIELASLETGSLNPVPVYERTPNLVPPSRERDAVILDPSSVADDAPAEAATSPQGDPDTPSSDTENAPTEAGQDTSEAEVTVTNSAPPIIPPPRPVSEEPEGTQQDTTDDVAALIEEALQDQAVPEQDTVVDDVRPKTRPEAMVATVEEISTPDDAPVRSRYALNISERPQNRPDSFASRVVRVATAPATEIATPAPAAASVQLPTSASVQQAATSEGAIKMRDLNLIGVSGSDGRRTALIRMPNGKIVSVNTGDKFSGYQVAAIGRNAVRIRKNGRDTVLEIPE